MKWLNCIQYFLEKICDIFFRFWPQKKPSQDLLEQAKCIAHRGLYDNQSILENTLAAFDAALAAGAWGIEFDLRWTKDGVPVVHHDASLGRLFGLDCLIEEMDVADLLAACPQIPLFEKIVSLYAGRCHLMIEFKTDPRCLPQSVVLDFFRLCGSLVPGEDYHILSLDPGFFEALYFFPPKTFLPIALYHIKKISDLALKKGYAGIAGHYLLVGNKSIQSHLTQGQKVGTGQINSKKLFYREIRRGVAWIFIDFFYWKRKSWF